MRQYQAVIGITVITAASGLARAENTGFMQITDTPIFQLAQYADAGSYAPGGCCPGSMMPLVTNYYDPDQDEKTDQGEPEGVGVNEQGSWTGTAGSYASWNAGNVTLPAYTPAGTVIQPTLNFSNEHQASYGLNIDPGMAPVATAGVNCRTLVQTGSSDNPFPLEWGMVTTDTSVTPTGTAIQCTAGLTFDGSAAFSGDNNQGGWDIVCSLGISADGVGVVSFTAQWGWVVYGYQDQNGNQVQDQEPFLLDNDPSYSLLGYFTGTVGTTDDPGTTVSASAYSSLVLLEAFPQAGSGPPTGVFNTDTESLPVYPRGGPYTGTGRADVTWELDATIPQ